MATSIHFKQYDSRWASKRYPTWGTGTMKYCGCGATTAAIVISSVDKSITPYKCAQELSKMKNGVTKGGATYLWALKKLMENHGFIVEKHTSSSSIFKALKRTDRETYGILDVWGTKNGVKWVSGGQDNGHYIPITSVKGEDMVYVKDPGLRKHTGWWDYSKYLSGHVKMSNGFFAMTMYHPSTVKKAAAAPAKKPSLIVEATSSGSRAVKKRAFYENTSYGKWYKVIRAKDPNKAAIIAREALEAVSKSNIKYNTTTKGYTLPKELKRVGWDMSKVKGTVYTSCTPLAMACVLCAGVGRDNPKYYQWARSSTNSIAGRLTATGQFTAFDYPKGGAGLKVGDIVISKTHGIIITGV